ncbi:MAG: alkaline phosphatase family protein [Myxococcales bacterium]|nr:alkaline phosphatase family protein [Myxococcales bacterium]MCB9581889.1 alkaline phosphatase family protein [Polyangiaceae bacterium]
MAWTSCANNRTRASAHPTSSGAAKLGLLQDREDGRESTVVVMAIDGVRWEDVFLGVERDLAAEKGLSESEILAPRELMPNLHTIIDGGGAAITNIYASGPNFVSLPGYMEMLSGVRPTGCTNNDCSRTKWHTVADDIASLPGVAPEQVAVISSWQGINHAAATHPEKLIVSTGRTRGENRELLEYDVKSAELLDAGEMAGPSPGHADFRRDRATAAIALRYLKQKKPRFMFLGLGETDEYAHKDDYRSYLRALSYADSVVGELATILDELGGEGRRTTLFVTTDHGRAAEFIRHGEDAPESSRVWLVAAGYGIRARGRVSPPVPRHLADIAATVREIQGIPPASESASALGELFTPDEQRVAVTVP